MFCIMVRDIVTDKDVKYIHLQMIWRPTSFCCRINREDEHITGQGKRPQMTFLFAYRTWKLEYSHLLSPEIDLRLSLP